MTKLRARMNMRIVFSLFSTCMATLLAGCSTFEGWNESSTASSRTQSQTQYSYLEERIRILTERVASLEQSNASLQRDLADIQARLAQLQGGTASQASSSDLQQLRAQVQALETQRERDKQAILDQVAREISNLAASGGRRGSGGSGSEVGYEHVVEKGQTLYDISKVYGVTVAAIKKANNLTSDTIQIGQKLFIPKSP